jgi:hypothetical protein
MISCKWLRFKCYWGSEDSMLCKLYSNANILFFLHVPWGASSFHLKHHFAVIVVFDFTWYHFVLNNIEGVVIPCLCTLYFNSNRIFCTQTLGGFLILFRALFWSYHNIFISFVLWIIWLLSSFVGSFFTMWSYFYLQSLILNIVWFPPSFHIWICAYVFNYTFGLCTHYRGTLSILAF